MQTYLPTAYKCIAIWGRNLGSDTSYIRNEQRLAAEQGAPLTAIYQSQDHVWALAGDIENTDLKNQFIYSLACLATGGWQSTTNQNEA